MKRNASLVVFGMLGIALLASGCAKKTTASKSSKLQKIHFDYDQALIKSGEEPILKANAEWLKANPTAKTTVEGHCDERGTNEYNIALGDRRANAAKRYIVNLGIDKKRLSTVSFGEEKPTAKCHDESCWSQNRRAEFAK